MLVQKTLLFDFNRAISGEEGLFPSHAFLPGIDS